METRPNDPMSSTKALWGGITFSFAFTALIWWTGVNYLDPGELSSERPGFWYQWQLVEPTFWTHATAWLGYLAHQVTMWGLIWYAQSRQLRYTKGLHRVNVWALAATAFFITLHLVQTHIWYDGLAQDVPEWTAQWSVIILLVAVLLMENQRRGLFFGVRAKGAFLAEAATTVRKYHGFYFAWATIYTFWYHPMEPHIGHLFGFMYMFLLFLQGCLFFTRIHINPYWTIFQEIAAIAHATLVAIAAGHAWPMFTFGFLGVFVVTQMHGLGLRRSTRWFIGLLWLAGIGAAYSQRGWNRLPELLAIPSTEWGAMFVLAALVILVQRFRRARPSPGSPG